MLTISLSRFIHFWAYLGRNTRMMIIWLRNWAHVKAPHKYQGNKRSLTSLSVNLLIEVIRWRSLNLYTIFSKPKQISDFILFLHDLSQTFTFHCWFCSLQDLVLTFSKAFYSVHPFYYNRDGERINIPCTFLLLADNLPLVIKWS